MFTTICHRFVIVFLILSYLEWGFSEPATIDELNVKYHVAKDKQNWFQALINCHSAGMELASITNEEEQKDLEKFMKENDHDCYWLSGTNLGTRKDYYWATRAAIVNYTNWLPKQPDNSKKEENHYDGENCIQWGLYDDSLDSGQWNDLTCTYKLSYICEDIVYCKNL